MAISLCDVQSKNVGFTDVYIALWRSKEPDEQFIRVVFKVEIKSLFMFQKRIPYGIIEEGMWCGVEIHKLRNQATCLHRDKILV